MGGSNYFANPVARYPEDLIENGKVGYENIKRNVTGYGVGLRHIEIRLIDTSRKTKRICKVLDSPAFQFRGVTSRLSNQKVGVKPF